MRLSPRSKYGSERAARGPGGGKIDTLGTREYWVRGICPGDDVPTPCTFTLGDSRTRVSASNHPTGTYQRTRSGGMEDPTYGTVRRRVERFCRMSILQYQHSPTGKMWTEEGYGDGTWHGLVMKAAEVVLKPERSGERLRTSWTATPAVKGYFVSLDWNVLRPQIGLDFPRLRDPRLLLLSQE